MPSCGPRRIKKGKLGAHAIKRVTAGAHLPTPWVFEPAKRPDYRADFCPDCRTTGSFIEPHYVMEICAYFFETMFSCRAFYPGNLCCGPLSSRWICLLPAKNSAILDITVTVVVMFCALQTVKFLLPIWVMLCVFQPLPSCQELDELIPALSDEGVSRTKCLI